MTSSLAQEWEGIPNENYINKKNGTLSTQQDREVSYQHNLPCVNQLYPEGAINQTPNKPYTANLIYSKEHFANEPTKTRNFTNVIKFGFVILLLQLLIIIFIFV